MEYFNLYLIPFGKSKKEKIFLCSDKSKKELEKIIIAYNKLTTKKFIITKVSEVEV